MSPRKRIRATPSDTPFLSPPAPSAVPALFPPQASSASKASDASADSVMAQSPASSAAPSVSEDPSTASRYASFKESKNKTRSWYGSWPRAPKSSASTQVARETILGGTTKPSAAPDFSRFDARKTGDDASSLGGGAESPALSRKASTVALDRLLGNGSAQPAAANGQPAGGRQPSLPKPKNTPVLVAAKAAATTEASVTSMDAAGTDAASRAAVAGPASGPMDTAQDEGAPAAQPQPVPGQGWFAWIARREASGPQPPATEPDLQPVHEPSPPEAPEPEALAPEGPAKDAQPEPAMAEQQRAPSGMWTYLWPGASQTMQTPASTQQTSPAGEVGQSDGKDAAGDTVMEDAPSAPIPVPPASSASSVRGASNGSAPATATASAGSTWAFWSRDSRKATGKSPGSAEPGEIAVIGERSEAHPKPAAGVTLSDQPSSKAASMKDVPPKDAVSKDGAKNVPASASKKSKRLRPKSMEIVDSASPVPGTLPSPAPASQAQAPAKGTDPVPSKQPAAVAAAAAAAATAATAAASATAAKGQQPAKAASPNILLPTFKSTYRLKENPSIVRQIAQLLLRTQQAPANHVFLSKETPKIRKAVAIGVHGLFPAAYLRPMIGQPTGTSIRFANHGAEAVRRWADSHGCGDCEIEKIALEGEGKIADRVENLWRLLLNWIDHVRSADLIVLACHSQGVPVGFMLLAKLIDLGIVTTARIGVCAMAGVSLGPFPDYKSGLGILMGSAGELWDFANPESEVSKRYETALRTVLDYGARVTFVGSIDDQVVPLESAIYSPVHHPYVYRAVFVDGRIHAPDFIAHLVGFACKLRNLGISDHGLVRELSVPLAGSLYSGEGHSRLYDDPQVYDLALSHALETADAPNAVCEIAKHEGLSSPNPYVLPWVLRGLLEEDFVKTELHSETAELVKQFDDWKPVTKALKDVKYRLEAVRSKL